MQKMPVTNVLNQENELQNTSLYIVIMQIYSVHDINCVESD